MIVAITPPGGSCRQALRERAVAVAREVVVDVQRVDLAAVLEDDALLLAEVAGAAPCRGPSDRRVATASSRNRPATRSAVQRSRVEAARPHVPPDDAARGLGRHVAVQRRAAAAARPPRPAARDGTCRCSRRVFTTPPRRPAASRRRRAARTGFAAARRCRRSRGRSRISTRLPLMPAPLGSRTPSSASQRRGGREPAGRLVVDHQHRRQAAAAQAGHFVDREHAAADRCRRRPGIAQVPAQFFGDLPRAGHVARRAVADPDDVLADRRAAELARRRTTCRRSAPA